MKVLVSFKGLFLKLWSYFIANSNMERRMYKKMQIKSKDFRHKFAINDKTFTNYGISEGFYHKINSNKIRCLSYIKAKLIINPFEISF